MIGKFSSTIDSVMHCQPRKGSGRIPGARAFERTYRLLVAQSATESILRAIALWLNPDGIILYSGRCNCLIAPITREKVPTT
nr:hypothetical protein [Nostoc sp. EkiNYC01]